MIRFSLPPPCTRPSDRRRPRAAEKLPLSVYPVRSEICLLLVACPARSASTPRIFRSQAPSPSLDGGACGAARATPCATARAMRDGDGVSISGSARGVRASSKLARASSARTRSSSVGPVETEALRSIFTLIETSIGSPFAARFTSTRTPSMPASWPRMYSALAPASSSLTLAASPRRFAIALSTIAAKTLPGFGSGSLFRAPFRRALTCAPRDSGAAAARSHRRTPTETCQKTPRAK